MDAVLAQLEEAASVQLTACTSEERRLAEAKILQFRSQSQPYELCYLILNQSSNDYLLYEAGRCLSHAVVREWTEVFSSSINDGDNSKATQLLAFLLNWASQRGQQVSAASRQRVLGAAGALVKRAAAAHAEEVAAAWRSNNIGMNTTQRRLARMRVLISPPDDPGPPCPILLRLIEHIERLIQPVVQGGMDIDLIKELHTLVRSSDLLGARTLSCFARLSTMTGPLTDPDTLNWTEELEQQPPSTAYQFRLLIFMDNLNFWLEDDTTDTSASTTPVLSAFSSEEQLAISEECAKRLVNPTSLPRIRLSQLFAYELPILSELVLTVVLRVSSAWEPVELALSLPSSIASGHCMDRDPQTIFQNASIVLVVLDRFFDRLCSLIIQKYRLNEASSVGQSFADACDEGEVVSLCCLCGKTFTSQSLLHKHFELMHEGTEIDTEQYDLSGFTGVSDTPTSSGTTDDSRKFSQNQFR
ncbi:hypothetical protein AHF37_05760 [Paragonimus kellicotti]|nr:hypothetical protein AHF37_05760 [Paragonimus kellicotti]